MKRLRAEAVVVGSGAGGAPVAAALAEAGRDVLVVEAGERLGPHHFNGVESEMVPRLMRAQPARRGGLEFYAGTCVGGSTVVNDALCWKTPPEVLAGWRETHGLPGLSDRLFAELNEQVFREVHAVPTDRAHTNRNAHHLAVGARALGWQVGPMHRNVRDCANLGLCNQGCPSNAKQSMLATYLPRAERAGARIESSLRVDRIRHQGGRVRGLEARRLDPRTRRPLEWIEIEAPLGGVAAGALATGALLAGSGVAGAGQGFQVHSSAAVTARFAEPVHAYYGPTMGWAVTEFADVLGGRGPGFMLENCAVSPITAAQALPGFGADHARAMAALPYLAKALVVLRDRSRGRVEPAGDGGSAVHYELSDADLERLRRGLEALARLYLASGALEVWLPLHGAPVATRESDLEWLRGRRLRSRDLSQLYAVHLFGGAVMGGSARSSALREDGRAWEIAGLYASDAATLPGATGVNPQVSVLSNALRIAGEILAAGGPS